MGLGRALAIAAAEAGDTVYGTVRHESHKGSFEDLVPGKTKAILMDVTIPELVANGVKEVLRLSSRIDVLVNNAGYGLFGAIEETSMDEARAQMETNFFGAMQLTKEVLPHMRKQGSGHIIQISSIAGFRGTEGLGIYNASKFALEGFSEALAKEMTAFGVHVTLVEPGPFRTDWAGRSSVRTKMVMPEYLRSAGARVRVIQTYSGTQPGSPEKAAALMLEVVNSPKPPLHLPLGDVAIDGFREKMKALEAEISEWESKSRATKFD